MCRSMMAWVEVSTQVGNGEIKSVQGCIAHINCLQHSNYKEVNLYWNKHKSQSYASIGSLLKHIKTQDDETSPYKCICSTLSLTQTLFLRISCVYISTVHVY